MLYRITQLVMATALLVVPARFVAVIATTAPATTQVTIAQAVAETKPFTIKFDTTLPAGVIVAAIPQPNFDTEVLAPLRAAQAAKAAAQAAAIKATKRAKRVATAATGIMAAPTDEALAKLRSCESGVYDRNSGNGYYGAYQYSVSTWAGYGGYARADLAPPAVQDAKVRADVARRGWTPWYNCAIRMGLM